jgi:hypothetical protein
MQLRDGEACQAAERGQEGERGQEHLACPAPPVTGSCSVRPPRGPTARWMHACDDGIPASPVRPRTVTAVSQRTADGARDTVMTIPGLGQDISAADSPPRLSAAGPSKVRAGTAARRLTDAPRGPSGRALHRGCK